MIIGVDKESFEEEIFQSEESTTGSVPSAGNLLKVNYKDTT